MQLINFLILQQKKNLFRKHFKFLFINSLLVIIILANQSILTVVRILLSVF